jgi:Tol biopolymer transport system component
LISPAPHYSRLPPEQGGALAFEPRPHLQEFFARRRVGTRLAWVEDGKCGQRVVLFDLRTRRRVSLEQAKGLSCTGAWLASAIAIGGQRVVWEAITNSSNSEFDARFVTAAANGRRNRVVGDMVGIKNDDVTDNRFELVAGDGPTVVFYSLCEVGCKHVTGRVRSVVGGKAHDLFAVARPLALAAAGRQVAVLNHVIPCTCNYGPRWSPDGRRIAWSNQGSVFVMDADGRGPRRLVSHPGDARAVEAPQWSPDGTKLAYGYAREPFGPSEVYVVNADGSGDHPLTAGRDPRWSPSGARLSFVRGGEVWTVDAGGSGARRLTKDPFDDAGAAEWAPDGTRLVAVRATGLYVIKAGGAGQSRIVRSVGGATDTARWSPSGNKIAWTHEGRVAVVGADGSGLRGLAEGADPVWSPDGTRLAFDVASGGGSTPIFVIAAAGGTAKAITPDSLVAGSPSWSPDGHTIVFGDNQNVNNDDPATAGVYTVAPNGSVLKRLAPDEHTGLDVRDIRTGARTRSFTIDGDASSMALSRSFLAVLVRTPLSGATTLHVYQPRTGALVGSVSVPQTSAPGLAVSTSGIVVYRVGRQIRAFDARTRLIRTIATVRTPTIGLSIDGRRLAWAENREQHSLIRALTLPARLR